jgi:hypothetical protein
VISFVAAVNAVEELRRCGGGEGYQMLVDQYKAYKEEQKFIAV